MKVLLALFVMANAAWAEEQRSMILASTTSTQNSGLLDYILPQFEGETGIHVYVVAVGTGQAMRIARNGDADAILVHHRPSEDVFMSQGYGEIRLDVMYNDFIIVGPSEDPAGVRHTSDAVGAFARIGAARARFVSRGDESGTNLLELSLWQTVNITPLGDWYLEVGAGMGAALNLASGLNAYTLTDRGTWLSFGNRGNLAILFEEDPVLLNPYGYIVLAPTRFPHIKHAEATELANWLVSKAGQAAIGAFQIAGEQLFCPAHLAADQPEQNNSICAANHLQDAR